MGADQFMDLGTGKNVTEAFNEARRIAAYDHGHSGYTGTIAEKPGYILIPRPDRVKAVTVLETIADAYWRPTAGDTGPKDKMASRGEKAWNLLVKWYGKADAERYMNTFNSKWDECIAVEASPAELRDYKERNNVGVFMSYKDGKLVKTVKKVRNFHLFYFGGWASS